MPLDQLVAEFVSWLMDCEETSDIHRIGYDAVAFRMNGKARLVSFK